VAFVRIRAGRTEVSRRLSDQVTAQLGRYYLGEAGLGRLVGCFKLAEDIAGSKDFGTRPFVAQGIAHLVREALGEISKALRDPLEGEWRRLSDVVVEAKTRVDAAPPDQLEGAVGALLAAVADLKRFIDGEERKHERGLVNLVADTTGATVMPATAREFGSLVRGLSQAAHSSQSLDHVMSLHERAVDVLELLFGHPETRATRLDELAALGRPTDENAEELVALITTDYELRAFLSSLPNSRWLWTLGHPDLLRPAPGSAWWPVIMLCERLRASDAGSIAGWLKRALAQWGQDPNCAAAIASAARALGMHGHGVLLKALGRHPDSVSVRREVRYAVQQAQPDSEFVEKAFVALESR